MMPIISGVVLAISGSLAALIVAKVTVVAALGLAVSALARRSRAALRHALLAVMFGAMLVLPIASFVTPPVHVAMPVAVAGRAALPPVFDAIEAFPSVATAADAAGVKPATPQAFRFSLSVLLLAGWIIGTAVFLLPVLTGLWQIRSLRRSGLPWLDEPWITETLALDAGIHRRVEILLHEALPGPITCGVLHPAILLPRDAESWAREDLSRAIIHELEHVRRRDAVTRCLARVVCAFYWFHPLVWIAWRKLLLEAERACDDAVLRCSEATAYADQLVGLAKRLPTDHRSPLLAMASRSDLAARVGAVLDGGQRRGQAGKFAITLACGTAMALLIAVSPLALVGAPQARDKPSFEVASVRPAQPLAPEESRPVLCLTGCGIGERFTISGDRVTIRYFALSRLIIVAYGLKAFPGLPNPTTPDRELQKLMSGQTFDIAAKIPAGVSADRVPEMLQALLSDRFKLSFHRETRQVAGYALVVGKNGPNLKPAGADADAPVPDTPGSERVATPQGEARFDGGGYAIAAGPFGPIRSYVDDKRNLHTDFLKISLAQLVQVLPFPDRPVQDMTGLKGYYQFSWARPAMAPPSPDTPVSHEAPEVTAGDAARSALEKAGLRLDSKTLSVDVLVIDHLESPSAN